MLSVFAFSLLASNGARALAIPAVEAVQSTCNNLHHCRTIWNIIWSCIATISACTWVTIHPNVPAPNDTKFAMFWRRVKVVLIALVAPEFIVMWAIRQWIVARELSRAVRAAGESPNGNTYRTKDGKGASCVVSNIFFSDVLTQEREWTKTHGFFASMGGFMLSHNGQLCHTLNASPYGIRRMIPPLIEYNYVDFNVTAKEINDRSKGDMLSKCLVVLQTTWFAMQCIARGVQSFPITELELVTLAFVSLNLVTYVLWWNKPLNVQCAIPVVLKRTIGDEDNWLKTQIRVDEGNVAELTLAAERLDACNEQGLGGRTLMAIQHAMEVIAEFATGSQDDEVELAFVKRVPTFFAGVLDTEDDRDANIVLAIVGIIFGAIHCIAWSSSFPSHMEQTLWRISCVAIVGVPSVYFIAYTVAGLFMGADDLWDLQPLLQMIVPPLLFVYLVGRVTLFVLAFMSLRALPPGVFETVQWATFILHI